MKNIRRILPYRLQLVNAAALDVADAVSCDATRERDTGQIIATVRVYGNSSRAAFKICEIDDGQTEVCIDLVEPAANLSDGGCGRTLTHLADSIEQLLENKLSVPATQASSDVYE